MVIVVGIVLILGFVYWRLYKTNMVVPKNAEIEIYR